MKYWFITAAYFCSLVGVILFAVGFVFFGALLKTLLAADKKGVVDQIDWWNLCIDKRAFFYCLIVGLFLMFCSRHLQKKYKIRGPFKRLGEDR